jgi:organic hydroperoxide reductase OsmC/OhrA
MEQHHARISWQADASPENMRAGHYSRKHRWTFDGGLEVAASSSPSVVPLPYSDPAAVDPEEAFVAAIASCHMLTFVHEARRQGFALVSYEDDALGEMGRNEHGVPIVSHVRLAPRIVFSEDKQPTPEALARLHHLAHEHCFIAQSVKTVIEVVAPKG